jgi:UV DNA damage endonuclease
MRTSFHPDQFTVLTNWQDDIIFQNSLADLEYHNTLCNLLGCDTILIHVGGVYNNKPKALEAFIGNFLRLSTDIQKKIHLENDDKSYNVLDVLELCETINVPMVLDIHHHNCNPVKNINLFKLMSRIILTWGNRKPKVHISSGKDSPTGRKHADYIDEEDFQYTLELTSNKFDIMIEAKSKDLAILKLLK